MPKQFKILNIDHCVESLDVLKEIAIVHPSYHVTHLDSSDSIYEIMHYQSFDLAILDFKVATENNYMLPRELQKAYPNIAILLLTDSDGERFSLDALEAGADGFFNKPFTYQKFAMTLERGYWLALDRLDWWTLNEETILAAEEACA